MLLKTENNFENIITIGSIPLKSPYRNIVHEQIKAGNAFANIKQLEIIGKYKNLVFDDIREEACKYIWDQAVKMMITTQTNDPTGSESTPTTGIVYIATSNQLLNRIAGNPYYLTWSIFDVDDQDRSPDGFWGSVLLLKSDGYRMNRVQVLTTKAPENEYFIEYQLKQL